MSPNQTEILIDHLDNSLQGNASPEMESLVANDPETAVEWSYLRLAVDAVQDAGLYEQIGAVKSAWSAQQVKVTPATGAIVRSLYGKVIRIAACILVLAGGAAVYKYTVTSSTGLYEKYYTSYALNTSRGAGAQDAMEQAYDNKNWPAVITLFNSANGKNNKSYFLAGMADLEQKKYEEAIEKFKKILAANALSGDDYFQDEAEFYLAMSWLAKGDMQDAGPMLGKIRGNKNHLYNQVVVRMSSLDLRIAAYKTAK
jgi:tetratricopeptide (TPR) repeat protein